MNVSVEKTLNPETPLERELLQDTDFLAGLMYGKPRHGHPEGAVIYHIKEVLDNIDKMATLDPHEREDLRIIALIHDTFKYKVDRTKSSYGENHHATYAWNFAKQYTSNPKILAIILKHDEAYNIWRRGNKSGNWEKARDEGSRLIKWLDDAIDLYKRFYFADNRTGDKTSEPFEWFRSLTVEYFENESK